MAAWLQRGSQPALAYRLTEGRAPTVVFLHGFMSDMSGTKAVHLEQWCKARGQRFLAADLQGHGQSQGVMRTATISLWIQDVLDLLDHLVPGPALLVGSSMGGWLALLAALARPAQITSLVLIAPAPDFTRWGLWDTLTPGEREAIKTAGLIERPSAYGPAPYVLTRALIEDGDRHLLLDGPIATCCPVRVLHGQNDPDVPWQRSLLLGEQLASPDVQLLFIKDGDHRLSRPADLALLCATIAGCLTNR